MRKTGFVYSSDYMKHETGRHPERPSRLLAIMRHLEDKNLLKEIIAIDPSEATNEQVSLIHDIHHIQNVETACIKGERHLDADTVISHGSYHAALLAAGGVIKAIDQVLSGKIDNAFCAVRPPGHHAEPNRVMGFCLFNNAAIGAKYAIEKKGAQRVFILDWDAHHGNGTQNAFYNDPQVFYVSLHQFPHYPGTGLREERGAGKGDGFTMNFPVPSGSGDKEYLSIIQKDIHPVILDYRPDLIIISAGFDAHADDPLSSVNLTSEGFRSMTEHIINAAMEACEGRIVSVLEGGYNLRAIGESAACHISALLGVENTR